ncbi:putative kinesin [Trypanosoma cruzi]|nr:putative kinesin [Trypanosoma cruzi]
MTRRLSSGNFPHAPLELPQNKTDASSISPISSRGENSFFSSVRSRNRNNRTPRESQSCQEFVHVVVRLKPPASHTDNSTVLRFSVDSGTLGTPRTGSRRIRSTPENVACPANNVEDESVSRGRVQQNEVVFSAGSKCLSSPATSALPATIPSNQNGLPQALASPRLGVAGGGKILTIAFPASDGAKETKHMYEFGDVIDPSVTDEQMCNSMVPGIIDQLKTGFNACVLCYGQTGSGKTHTINVLIPAFITALFDALDAENDIVELSYIQVYNNNVYNLLGENKSEHGVILHKPRGTLVTEPRYLLRDAADAKSKIAEAQRKRFVGSHVLNARSSRSHALLSFHVTKCIEGIPVLKSRLTLGDLAGSERVKKTGVVGEELEEAIAINKSLSVLHAVIRATADDADVLPVRESILTLYLASTLTDCYLLLIATVSMEKRDYAETKNSLDFATTAKRCALTKSKSRARDFLMNGINSFEETYTHLMKEVETLRRRVCTLQEEVNIEKQRSAILSKDDSLDKTPEKAANRCKADDNSMLVEENPEAARMRGHVLELERQCAVFQSILRDRENELNAFESRGDIAEKVRRELQQQAREREEAQRTLEEAAPQLETSELLRKVTDTIVWMQEQLDGVCQQKKFMMKAMEGMRCEQHRIMTDLLEARKNVLQLENAQEESLRKFNDVFAENTKLKGIIDELNLKLLREYAERAIREETMSWFKALTERDEQYERLRAAFEDQRNLCDVLQSRLNSTEQELDRSSKHQGALLQEMRKKDEAFRTIWLFLTPQQKARFMSFGDQGEGPNGTPSSSLHQGHENVQLRSQIRTVKRQLEEEFLRNKELEYRIEDLEKENELLKKQLQNCEDEYKSLVSLEQDYREEREHMEQQIAYLFTYIEEHNAKQQVSERQLCELKSEWERLNEEHRNTQREVVELTAKLEQAKGEIWAQGVDNNKLKDRLKEVKKQDALLAGLHRQLTATQHIGDEASRRLGIADRMQQHVASEANIYNHHGDIIKRKAIRRNSDTLLKALMQRVDSAQRVRGAAVQPLPLNNRVQRLRNEVSQQFRLCGPSSLSFNGTARTREESFGSSHTHHSGSRRRKRTMLHKPHDLRSKSLFRSSNFVVAEVPSFIIDRTRRRNV